MRYLPRWGSLQRSPDPLAGNGEGPPGKGREKERMKREGRGGVERGGV